MTQIFRANEGFQIQQIADLAKDIWSEHYTPIIGAEQVAYMLEKIQSVAAITKQEQEGAEYYLIVYNEKPAGYFCINQNKTALFLSKLYVLNALRGKGIGKAAMLYIEQKALSNGYAKISLTVNKYNSFAIKAYEKMGFKNIKPVVQDIGNDFIMDDYLLEKTL